MRIFSWNVNGLRAGLKKGTFLDFMNTKNPDILCLQETKAKADQVEIDLPNYTEYWNSAERAGYSGTSIFSKNPAINCCTEFDPKLIQHYNWQNDKYGCPLTEGRLQIAEYEHFCLVNVYTPNSKPDLSRLQLRKQIWDPAILQQLQLLEQTKPIIICGDFNAAHTEIELAPNKILITPVSLAKNARELPTYSVPVSSTHSALSILKSNAILGGHIGDTPAKITSDGALTTFSFLNPYYLILSPPRFTNISLAPITVLYQSNWSSSNARFCND